MKILFISEFYPPYIEGGAEISTSLLARWLSKGHDVFVACSQFANESWTDDEIPVYPILLKASVGTKNFFSAIKYALGILIAPIVSSVRVVRLVKKIEPDVVDMVVTLYYFIPIVLAVKLFARRPLFIDCRDYNLICPLAFKNNEKEDPKQSHHGYRCFLNGYRLQSSFMRLFMLPFAIYESFIFNLYKSTLRYTINNFNGITLVPLSQYVQEQLVLNGFHRDKTVVIPNISKPVMGGSDHLKKSTVPTFTYGGRIETEKGIWDIVSAVESLHAELKDPFMVKIAGTGSVFGSLKNYLEKHPSLPITLLGKLEPGKVLELYQESLAILAPSRWPEPFGRFIQESISTGTPVIATATGGIPEGIQNGVNGILVGAGKPDELAAAMRSFINDPSQSERMGARMIQEYWRYEGDTIGKRRLELYSSLRQ